MKIINKIIRSFDNEKGGFSARKLSAFAAVAISSECTIRYGSESNAVELTAIWLIFGLLCLSVVTFEQITRFKNGN